MKENISLLIMIERWFSVSGSGITYITWVVWFGNGVMEEWVVERRADISD
jgi:hypothetical protein